MKTIKLLGTKPKGHPFPIISWAIRLFELSSISHVGILFCDENKVFDAHFNNIRFTDLSEYSKVNNIKFTEEVQISDDQYRRLLDFKDSKEPKQKGYFTTLFGVLIPQLIRNITFGWVKGIPNLGIGEKGYTCSVLARQLPIQLGMPDSLLVDQGVDKWNYTTKDALKLYKEWGELNS